eukprot:GDKI01030429.1.p1 GENE.GDKI01030429.1~~GDKI01030429.1.p1  ORF type:complete len:280 (-),score=77.88 GDKI01030429.1:22-861(-)
MTDHHALDSSRFPGMLIPEEGGKKKVIKCKRFEGKVCVVTASTAGIGLAIARRLLQEGGDVVISSRRQGNVDDVLMDLKSEGYDNVRGIACHVSNPKDRHRLLEFTLEWRGRVDVLVSNAAASTSFGSTLDTSEDGWNKMFDTNVKAAFLLAREFAPKIPPNGCILFVSSYLAFQPEQPIGVYGITKTALLGLTKALAAELGSSGIRVNCLAPGVVKTNFSRLLWESEAANAEMTKRTQLGRLAETEEMAGPAAFLCSEDASYVTGETLVAAGGMQSRL